MQAQVGDYYNNQAKGYIEFSKDNFSWRFIEKPGFDKYISDLYQPDRRILDIGCGGGRIISYLIQQGVMPDNIVGIEPSIELIKYARENLPRETSLITMSLEELALKQNIFDLVTANMVFHYLDTPSLLTGLDKIYDVLKPEGILSFIDTDPDHNEESRKPENLDKWMIQETPWGTEMPVFNRHPRTLLNLIDYAGFDLQTGWQLKVEEEGKRFPELYTKYSSRNSRIGGRFVRVSEREKETRRDPRPIPNLTR